MRTAIIYYSKHGTTEQVVHLIGEKLNKKEEMDKAFPEFLQRLTISKTILGGEFHFNKINFIGKFLTRKIAKANSSISRLRSDVIANFTTRIIKQLSELNK